MVPVRRHGDRAQRELQRTDRRRRERRRRIPRERRGRHLHTQPGGTRVSSQPTAVWLDRIAAINGGMGLRAHLDEALKQKGSGDLVVQLVVYDLPGRDCAALASNGELGPNDLDKYKAQYIDEEAMAWLGSRLPGKPGLIVDAGSGPGVVSAQFARAFPDARVVAVDGSEPLLERARARAARLGHADRFATLAGDLPGVLARLEYPADLIWAGNSLHHLGDQRAALAAFAEHLAPGGTLALLEGGLPARYLPRDFGIGRPGLQTRLDAIKSDRFSRMRQELPGSVAETEDWAALMTAAGLEPAGTRSFLLDVPAPVSADARAYVAATFDRLREGLGDGLDAGDRATLDRLLDPEDEAGVHRRPDVFVLKAHTVHTALRPF